MPLYSSSSYNVIVLRVVVGTMSNPSSSVSSSPSLLDRDSYKNLKPVAGDHYADCASSYVATLVVSVIKLALPVKCSSDG